MADVCSIVEQERFEAFMEAAIIFARTALHRLQTEHRRHPQWKSWFDSLLANDSVTFIRSERDFILKDGPPKVGQIIGGAPTRAAQMYYYENASIPATDTAPPYR